MSHAASTLSMAPALAGGVEGSLVCSERGCQPLNVPPTWDWAILVWVIMG